MPSRATRSSGWVWPRRCVNQQRRAARWSAAGALAAGALAAGALAAGALAAGALALGCSGPPGAGGALGTDLGTFGVDGTLGTNECGPGALGSTATLAFDVELARADTELFWDGRVGGRIGPELDFEFSARSSVELRPARGADAGCSIVREDLIAGVLAPDASGALTAFSAEMRFDFATRAGSACTAEDQDQAGLPRLPCRISYALSGRRTRAPMP